MKPAGLKTKIFLDSGDVEETKAILHILGFLDGQTTNPTLIAKNPYAKERFLKGEKFTKEEIFDFYKKVVTEISDYMRKGSVSVEVYADKDTTADEMFKQGQEMAKWIPNAWVKYPICDAGIECAKRSTEANIPINMTLCFNQKQAGAVYDATMGAKKGNVFISPFVGRLDDIGENGMDIIKNIIEMYKNGDGHVEVLSASVRSMEHFMASLYLECDIITAPFSILKEWGEKGLPMPEKDFVYNSNVTNLKNIPYEKIDLKKSYKDVDMHHELTEKGIARFASDWNGLIK